MQYRRMGRTGLKVSELCLGTMTFGHGTEEADALKMVDMAFDAGVNFFDTANSYSGGVAEEILGKALQGRRRDAIIASKFFNPMGHHPNDSGMSRRHILHAVEDSLRRLQTDYLDVYYIHHVDSQTPLDEMLRALNDLVQQGKVRYIAASNYEAWRLLESLWISDHNGWHRFSCYQPLYNLVVRDIEQEIVPICQNKGVGIVTWGPLAGGFLTGKYHPGERSKEGTRSDEGWVFPSRFFAPNADETLKILLEIAEELGRSPAQVALRWIVQQPFITSAIVGARTLKHAEDNLRASTWELPPDALNRLNEVSYLPPRYPLAMEENMHERRDKAVNMPSWSES